jgi:hypothetical protein
MLHGLREIPVNPRSQTIYGRLVETFGPYPRHYTRADTSIKITRLSIDHWQWAVKQLAQTQLLLPLKLYSTLLAKILLFKLYFIPDI